ncbi:MAG: fatty acid desaturase family protein [Haloechinothrix sp.]
MTTTSPALTYGSTDTPTAQGSDYSHLMRQVRESGLLGRRYGYYFAKIALTGLALAGGWAALGLLGDSWFQLIVAGYLGFMFTQVAFIGHDAGHRQIFKSRKLSTIVGWIHGNLFVGLSYGWWIDKHTRHHSHPNHEGRDPDIDPDVVVFRAEDADAPRAGWVTSLVTRHQAVLFFPLLLLEGFHLHVASMRALLTQPSIRARWAEGALLVLHLAGFIAVLLIFMSPVKALTFFALQQAVFGLYMGCSFAPNHKGMPIFARGVKVDFLRRQVLTSRNIRGGPIVDFLLGGLNYQIEHHLFPSMPRPNLRKAQALVRGFCDQHKIAYCQTGAARSYLEVLRHLHEVSRPLRSRGREATHLAQ